MSKLEAKPWHERANCRGTNPAIFFPEPVTADGSIKSRGKRFKQDGTPTDAEKKYQRKVEKSKRICAGCPVMGDCLEYAEVRRLKVGTYGGETSEERLRRWKRRSA